MLGIILGCVQCNQVARFFYDQPLENMQIGTTFFTSEIGVGNILNNFMVIMVDKIIGRDGGE